MQKIINFITPDNYILNGMYSGPEKAQSVFIFVHGFTASMFSVEILGDYFQSNNFGVMSFNNRGFGYISKIRKLDPESDKKYKSVSIGGAHEVFTECVNDIDGAINWAIENKFKNIYLVGHSTGCQKIVYSASKLQDKYKELKALILLAPISDMAATRNLVPKRVINKAYKYAEKQIQKGKPHQLLPEKLWEGVIDAQRFISLNDQSSEEEIFCYSQENKTPKTLKSIKLPIIAIVGENDQFLDRSAEELMIWFKDNLKVGDGTSIIRDTDHGFTAKEKETSEVINKFLRY